MNDLSVIKKTFNDIKSIRVQGATNVAKAVVDGMVVFSRSAKKYSWAKKYKRVFEVGDILANARPNEPLARNAVRFLRYSVDNSEDKTDFDTDLEKGANEFFEILSRSKQDMINFGIDFLKDKNTFLTHCHSTSVENIFKGLNLLNDDILVYSTETRPLYQGRITATNLYKSGIKTAAVSDSAAAAVIMSRFWDQRASSDVQAVLIGCDEMSVKGDVINKIGSLQIAIACKEVKVPLYVVTTLLKINDSWEGGGDDKEIESRSGEEVWKDAPAGITILNPAFDLIDRSYIQGYITEAGVLRSVSLNSKRKQRFKWMK